MHTNCAVKVPPRGSFSWGPSMVSLRPLLQRRCLCTKLHDKWSVKQVMKSNFAESLEEIKTRISDSDFIAVSLQKTGSFSAPWQRVLPFDTAETAYCKAKYAAEKFQLLQFAVCPFTISDSKLVAHPWVLSMPKLNLYEFTNLIEKKKKIVGNEKIGYCVLLGIGYIWMLCFKNSFLFGLNVVLQKQFLVWFECPFTVNDY